MQLYGSASAEPFFVAHEKTFRLLPLVAATLPLLSLRDIFPGREKSALKGTASAVTIKFPAQLKGVPLGELSSVARLREYPSQRRPRHDADAGHRNP